MPTSPIKAVQRFPSQRMRPLLSSTRKAGIRSSSASLSVENRGQSDENEQQAPQVRHTAAPPSSESTASSIIDQSTCAPFAVLRAMTVRRRYSSKVRARAPTGPRGTPGPRTHRPLPRRPGRRTLHHSDSARKTYKSALVRSPSQSLSESSASVYCRCFAGTRVHPWRPKADRVNGLKC